MSTLAGLVTASGDGKTLPLLGTLKVSGLQTGGGFEVIEYEGPIHPAPHIHREREEAFYVLTGSFTFEVGEGGFVLVPRGIRHGFIAAAGGGLHRVCRILAGARSERIVALALRPRRHARQNPVAGLRVAGALPAQCRCRVRGITERTLPPRPVTTRLDGDP
jgi:hypothetical protein